VKSEKEFEGGVQTRKKEKASLQLRMMNRARIQKNVQISIRQEANELGSKDAVSQNIKKGFQNTRSTENTVRRNIRRG